MSKLPELIVTEDYAGYDYADLVASMDGETSQRFKEWIRGQTCAIHKGRSLVYAHDYRNFAEGGVDFEWR